MYIPIGPSKKQLYKIILLLLCLLFGFKSCVKALEYTIDINMKNQINLGSNLSDKFFINDSSNPELVLDINKIISCDTNICLASIPLTLSAYSTVAGSYQSGDIISHTWDYLGMYAQLWGASPNYSCTYSNGTLDCPITNGQELKKIEIFTGQKNTQTGVVNYSRGAFLNVYNITNVGTVISNIQNNTNDIKNSINSDNVDNNQANSFFNDFSSSTPQGFVSLINKPLDFLNGLYNTCSPISVYVPYFDFDLTLPCISSIQNGIFDTIIPIARIIINGLICYRLVLGFINIINKLKDPNDSDIEVVDL